MVPPLSSLFFSTSALLWTCLCLAAFLAASPSPSHRLNPDVLPPRLPSDLEPRPASHARARVLANSRAQSTAASLPDSIRDFRFNAPIPHVHPQPADFDSDAEPAKAPAPSEFGEPSIDDLILSPLVLAVTVDGQVHALKRDTGHWVWTLHDDGGAALGGSSAEERLRRTKAGTVVGSPLVKAAGRKQQRSQARANETGLSNVRSEWAAAAADEDQDEDEVYVIEPYSAGDIYLYTRDKSSAGGTLEKLPLSMQQLVALSPFTFPSDASRMFVGRKETNLVGVDLRTGRLVGVFGSNTNRWCEWDESRQRRVRTAQECEEDITRRPEDLLYMARTEYHLSIYAKSSSDLLQTLTYTTYSSSSLGGTLQEQWTRTPDGRYLQPMHDGSLLCFLSGVSGIQWGVGFDYPVVSVFDIALPPTVPGQDETPQPLMFEQPHSVVAQGLPKTFDDLSTLPEAAYIGKIGDDLYAMSRDHFPLVAIAQPPPSHAEGLGGTIDAALDAEPRPTVAACHGVECLVGRHQLLRSGRAPLDNTIDPPSELLQIEGPPASQSTATPSPSSPHAPNRSGALSELHHPVKHLSAAKTSTLVTALLILLGYLSFRKFWTPKAHHAVETRVRMLGKDWLDIAPPSDSAKGLDASLPPTPVHGSRPPTPLPLPVHVELLPPHATPDLRSPGTPPPLSPPSLNSTPSSSPVTRTRSHSLSSPTLDSKELPPIPAIPGGGDEGESDADCDADGDAKDGGGTPRQNKKPSRRRRGKKKKGPKASEELLMAGLFPEGDPIPQEAELRALTLGEADVKEDAVVEGDPLRADPQVIGGLAVSETILGYGSHGTVVLRGEFQGRAVAVKRLLKDFVTIATHEVALLQESDDHPHVIRYFCKEQRDTFLYIALELCPASLFDLIDQPTVYPDLSRDFDPKRALRQITSGIRHLHQLKIVHRDIKPQNILVSTSKHGGVRMLISDFGLCKKLDVDESSFQQTVNHAAGSFGYRAPEVLRGQVDPNAGASGTPNGTLDSRGATSGGGSVGSGTNADPSLRLTRSIDIFSLGCIFYYVLTGGEHPFGGRYEREMNILRGKLSLELLDGLGEEALEAQDLISRMVASDPRERPSAEAVLLHPFFWNAQKRLLFICDASDRFEIMERDPPDATLVSLECSACDVVGDDWQKSVDRTLLDNLGKYRKYDGKSVRDLLRVLRNKKHHYQDLPEGVRRSLGDLPGGFLSYFTSRFPRLLLHVYETVATHLSEEAMFSSTFQIPADEQ